MKKIYNFSFLLLMFLCVNASAQDERYIDEVFEDSDIVVEPGLTYAVNTTLLFASVAGEAVPIPLMMDVYYPSADVDTETDRPLVIYMHTGNFVPQPDFCSISGRRDDNTSVGIINRLVKRGYVVASIDYRLGWNPGATMQEVRTATLIQAAYRGVQDARSAVRFFRKSVVDDANPYGIDPDKVVTWGVGTGGYISFAVNALDDYQDVILDKFILSNDLPMVRENTHGNPEGTTFGIQDMFTTGVPPVGDTLNIPTNVNFNDGTPISSEIQMSVNAGGALGDLSWLDASDAPMVSFHVPVDPNAPYNTDVLIVPTTGQQVVEVSGSFDVQAQANALGINDIFDNYDGDDAFTMSADQLNDGNNGLYPFFRAPVPTGSGDPILEGAPWDWWIQSEWDTVICNFGAGTGIPLNSIGLAGDPLMTPERGMIYQDSMMGYFAPRACLALGLGCQSVGTKDIISASSVALSIAPNPATTEIRFTTNDENPMESIEIYNYAGQLMTSRRVEGNNFTLNRDGLSNGMYIAKIQFEKGIVSKKVVFN